MNGGLKRLLETLGVASGATSLFRQLKRNRALILAYHNVVPDEAGPCGDSSLHLSRSRFGRQLDRLLATHEVVSLRHMLAQGASGSRPNVAITFDDAYAGALTLGLEELGRRGLPATIFVAPGLLGRQAMWWDLLAEHRGGSIPDDLRRKMLLDHRGDRGEVLRQTGAEAAQSRIPWYARTADLEMLEKAAEQPGIDLGDHSWSHPDLAHSTDERVSEDLRRCREFMEERFPGSLPILAYPYGSYSGKVESIVRSAGYEYGLRVEGGWMPTAIRDPLALPRLNVPAGVSGRGFELRVSGVPLR